jgi:REP element-mobilizing transposase RayT
MWNDADFPLAYLITFRCYGTWLHGDKRGSTNRFRNRYGSSFLPPEEKWLKINKDRRKRDPVKLTTKQRTCVETAIKETRVRQWRLFATNVRTNHVHIVVLAGLKGSEIILNAFKANATREMRKSGCWHDPKNSPWADKGSKRNLWNEKSIQQAIEYVLYRQGDELPKFD